jgi:hypothetical protein
MSFGIARKTIIEKRDLALLGEGQTLTCRGGSKLAVQSSSIDSPFVKSSLDFFLDFSDFLSSLDVLLIPILEAPPVCFISECPSAVRSYQVKERTLLRSKIGEGNKARGCGFYF